MEREDWAVCRDVDKWRCPHCNRRFVLFNPLLTVPNQKLCDCGQRMIYHGSTFFPVGTVFIWDEEPV